jgi:hypothetical protein
MDNFLEFVLLFQRALKAFQLYGAGHPRHKDSLASLDLGYRKLLEGRAQMQVAARNGRLFVDRALEEAENLQVRALARILEERSIHSMVFFPGADRRELAALLDVLITKPGNLRNSGGAKKVLEEQDVTRIRILAARLEDVSEAGEVAANLLESVAGMARMAAMSAGRGTSAGTGTGENNPAGGGPGPAEGSGRAGTSTDEALLRGGFGPGAGHGGFGPAGPPSPRVSRARPPAAGPSSLEATPERRAARDRT